MTTKAIKKETDYIKLAAQLNRLQLKLYGFSVKDMLAIDAEELTEEELNNLAADAHLYYRIKGFKNKLDQLIMMEMKAMVETGVHDAQVQFIRGSISFGTKLKQWFEAQVPAAVEDQQGKQPNAGGISL